MSQIDRASGRTRVLMVSSAMFIVSILLAASLVALIPSGDATDPRADTLSADSVSFDEYIPITNAQELSDVRNHVLGKYYLANDIVFSGGSGSNFEPIGSMSQGFEGIFDGNGHVIYGLRTEVNSSDAAHSGLFGYVYGGKIMNLGLVNSSSVAISSSSGAYAGGIVGLSTWGSVTNCYYVGSVSATAYSPSNAYAGGLIGQTSSSDVSNCYNTGPVTASALSYAYAGGIVGRMSSSSSSITNCYNTGPVTASSPSSDESNAGGIVGNMSSLSSITNCYNTGSVTASASSSNAYVGGIAGRTSSSITGCYNTGSVTGTSSLSSTVYAGGIAGSVSYSSPITKCYNTGSVTGTSSSSSTVYAGGIAGGASSSIAVCYNTGPISASTSTSYLNTSVGGIVGYLSSSDGTITNCYNTGSVSVSSLSSVYAGGIAGYLLLGSVTNCYNTGSVSVPSLSYNVRAGGIVGNASSSSSSLTNCYYLTEQLFFNGSQGADALCGYGSPIVDGNDTSYRSTYAPDQRSSTAKTLDEMTPKYFTPGTSTIYFTGMTNLREGWNFYTIWTIDEGSSPINGGLPILTAFLPTVYIMEGPRETAVLAGEAAAFSASISTTDAVVLNYQWQISTDGGLIWEDIPGIHGLDYVTPVTDLSFSGNLYRLMITATGYYDFELISESATLIVLPSFTVSGRVISNTGLALGATITYTVNNGDPQMKDTGPGASIKIIAEVGNIVTITNVETNNYMVFDPMPRPFTGDDTVEIIMYNYFKVSGKITNNGQGVGGMKIIYKIDNGPSLTAVTDANGNYSMVAKVGETIRTTAAQLDGYVVKGFEPASYMTNTTANFTWTPEKPGFGLGTVPLMIIIGAIVGGIIGGVCYFVFKKR